MNRRLWGLAPVGLLVCLPAVGSAQADSTMAQEGIYDRPFIGAVNSTSIGGYLEGNTNYFVEEGVTEGFSMELRRFNIFLFSSISRNVRFLSELEFEHGTEEIALETALVDVLFDPAFVLRAGILLPPLGYLNQNHDSPKWDWVDRPLVTTGVIPSTLSEVGFGAYGRVPAVGGSLSYDLYLTNGLQDGIVDNDLGRTDLASGKSETAFEEDNNGSPTLSGRVAYRRTSLGEVGVSYYGGYYNSFKLEGVEVDDRRWVGIGALDVSTAVGPFEIRGEAAVASIGIPDGMTELFGDRQWGAYLDVVWSGWNPQFLGYQDARLQFGLRTEHVDYNDGRFGATGRPIRDDVTALVPTVSFRPTAETVFRANYRYHWSRDFVGNPTQRLAGWQLGLATYF